MGVIGLAVPLFVDSVKKKTVTQPTKLLSTRHEKVCKYAQTIGATSIYKKYCAVKTLLLRSLRKKMCKQIPKKSHKSCKNTQQKHVKW